MNKKKTAKDFRYRWKNDVHFRTAVSLYGTLIYNVLYAVFMLALGIWHKTFWFYSLSIYYTLLSIMRFVLFNHTRKQNLGENIKSELVKYRACGIIFLVMNLVLSIIIFFMIYWNKSFIHHEITTIAMAMFTFIAFALAIKNVIKYRKYNSPIISSARAISFTSALVSMITLESTMLTTFGGKSLDADFRTIMLAVSGGVVSAIIIATSLLMIIRSTKRIKELTKRRNNNGNK